MVLGWIVHRICLWDRFIQTVQLLTQTSGALAQARRRPLNQVRIYAETGDAGQQRGNRSVIIQAMNDHIN